MRRQEASQPLARYDRRKPEFRPPGEHVLHHGAFWEGHFRYRALDGRIDDGQRGAVRGTAQVAPLGGRSREHGRVNLECLRLWNDRDVALGVYSRAQTPVQGLGIVNVQVFVHEVDELLAESDLREDVADLACASGRRSLHLGDQRAYTRAAAQDGEIAQAAEP